MKNMRAPRTRRGYTLPELLVAMTVFFVLTVALMGVYLTTIRLCASLTSTSVASMDAARAISRVTETLREAQAFELMDGGDYGTTYDASAVGGVIPVTGLRILMPAVRSGVSVVTNTGTQTLTGGNYLWTPSASATIPALTTDGAGRPLAQAGVACFYRANWKQNEGADGTPNPTRGKALWLTQSQNGASVSAPVVTDLAPKADAVQFIQPLYANGAAIRSQVKVKLTCSVYDPTDGATSSDNPQGRVGAVSGECIYLRDNNPDAQVTLTPNGHQQTEGS